MSETSQQPSIPPDFAQAIEDSQAVLAIYSAAMARMCRLAADRLDAGRDLFTSVAELGQFMRVITAATNEAMQTAVRAIHAPPIDANEVLKERSVGRGFEILCENMLADVRRGTVSFDCVAALHAHSREYMIALHERAEGAALCG